MNRLTHIPRNGRIIRSRSRRSAFPIPHSALSAARHRRTCDSYPLSAHDYAAIVAMEKQRCLSLLIAICCLFIVAACLYLAQS